MTGTDPTNELARRIRAARAYAALGQEDVADSLGVSRATVSAWERGVNPIPPIARPGVIEGLLRITGLDREFFDGCEPIREENR